MTWSLHLPFDRRHLVLLAGPVLAVLLMIGLTEWGVLRVSHASERIAGLSDATYKIVDQRGEALRDGVLLYQRGGGAGERDTSPAYWAVDVAVKTMRAETDRLTDASREEALTLKRQLTWLVVTLCLVGVGLGAALGMLIARQFLASASEAPAEADDDAPAARTALAASNVVALEPPPAVGGSLAA